MTDTQITKLSGPSRAPAGGGAPRQLVIFLHGYGADGNDLIGLAPFFAQALPHAEFLELIFQDELHVREQRQIARRHQSASFRESRSLENFDFSFNPSIARGRIYELAACHFIRQQRDVLWSDRPASAKATWRKPSAKKRYGPASSSSTGRSSTWCANSCPSRPRQAKAG